MQAEVTSAVQSALSYELAAPEFCFMRLSGTDIRLLGTHLGTRVIQQPTRHSILVKDATNFWKCIPRLQEERNVVSLQRLQDQGLKHVTFWSERRDLGPVCFLKFPAHVPPLLMHEVKQCLSDFMTRTARALEELHRSKFAHLDVRLPNICFA